MTRHSPRAGRHAAKPIQVAAGLVARDGRFLICRRPPHVHFGGSWEFPGGKREPGESLAGCLRRELREELGVEISPPVPFAVVSHEYPGRAIELHVFRCTIARGEPEALQCRELLWVLPKELERYDFPPADRSVIERLKDEAARS